MKNLLLILLISVLSASCLTVKKIEKNCDLFAAVCITEKETESETETSTNTETTSSDTTATVFIPGEKTKDEIPVKVVLPDPITQPENKKPIKIKKKYVNSDLSILTVPFAISYAQVVNSKLKHELVQTDTTLRIKLENALKVVKTLEKQNKILKEKYVVTVKENKPFAKFTIKWFLVSVILILIFLTLAFFKYKNKILGIMK